MAASTKHSSETSEQYTPEHILDRVRNVLGHIDLDPASTPLANERVLADAIFTAEDGERTFEDPWKGKVFLNPPGGAQMVISGTGIRSNPALFWSKLMFEWREHNTEMAIVLGFTMEVLQTTQAEEEYPMLRFPFCIPRQRIKFDVPREERIRQLKKRRSKAQGTRLRALERQIEELEASTERIVTGEQPPHGNVIVCVPPLSEHNFGEDRHGDSWVAWGGPVTRRFQRVFSEIGYVRI